MTPFPKPEEIAELQRKARAALAKLEAKEYQSEDERQRLVQESWPHAWTPPGRSKGGLYVRWDLECQAYIVHDHGGFLTSILSEENLRRVLVEEAEHPGFLRGRLRKIGDRYPSREEVRQMIEAAEEQRRIQRHNLQGKRDIGDLDLDLEIEL